jgi:hypothetical protein
MLSKQQRILFFLLGCIGVRSILALAPLYIPERMLPILGITTLTIGTSFLFLYFTNGRMNAPEGGGVTWWAKYRLIHGLLYLAASIYLFNRDRTAWIPLANDVFLGLLIFLFKYIN